MNSKKNVRVLIAEDDSLVSQMIQRVLKLIDCTVIGEARNGQQAIEMAQNMQPDVILMDIEMPDMDGLEATFHIQASCPTPVVVLTAFDAPGLVEQAGEVGVGAYLLKPPKARDMERAITIAMARFGDMMELRRLNAELQGRNQELQARNEDLDAYAHTVAHDLKDPLSLIVAYADRLKEEARLPDTLQVYLNAIARSGRKMNNIIDELQLLASVRKAKVELKPLNMSRIIAEAQQRLVHLIEKYQAEFVIVANWPVALGHAPWIEEVWTNFLSNGIKYGGQPPRLVLGATVRTDGMARFWIRDNGPGLTPAEQAQLFKPFTQLNQHRAEGYGLGLSIVRRIVEKQGGQIGVESDGVPGQGCTFSFTLATIPADIDD
ncbi:MAG: hybrid sensor histidine kinase/response regulator [Anaerolineales bacterium]|nr:hybrid sensor histidine kinase/response regulator [Anaerolineales bacterium]